MRTKTDILLDIAFLAMMGFGIWQFGWVAVWAIAFVILRDVVSERHPF